MALTLEALRGRILDTDSHEMIPVPRWGEMFGEAGLRFADSSRKQMEALDAMDVQKADGTMTMAVDYEDNKEVTPTSVWTTKGASAPSAIDMRRRHAVLDEMGVARALIFSGIAIPAWVEAHGGGYGGTPIVSPEGRQMGHDVLAAYQEWSVANMTDRARIPGVLQFNTPGLTPDQLAKDAEALIKLGFKAIFFGPGYPPAGVSPGDPALDRFYAILSEANVPLVTHPPGGMGIMSPEWNKAAGRALFELNFSLAEENFIGLMILGGVFDRHPNLRVGFVESRAGWVGQLAERMDFSYSVAPLRTMLRKPSEYLNSNVRVSVLVDEPVEEWFQRYPQVQDCFCFSSDFPHREGGHWSAKNFYERLAPLGDTVLEKFFCKNAELVLPA